MRQPLVPSFFIAIVFLFTVPEVVFAANAPAKTIVDPLAAFLVLHPELKALFDPKTRLAKPGTVTEAVSLEDWAKQFGWREYESLKSFKPKGAIPTLRKEALAAPELSTSGYVVLDRSTGLIITAKNPGLVRPIASLTKLMTADTVLRRGVSKSKIKSILAADKVGGSALGVKAGTRFTVDDLFYASFLASANDATNALALSTGLSKKNFVAAMNKQARALGLSRTTFADPTGIDERNVSTPREFALLADSVFKQRDVRRYATTATRTIHVVNKKRTPITVKNSDGLLWKEEYDDLFVTAGKTGYLGPEYGWNIAVALKDTHNAAHPELLVVLFGTETLAQSMKNVESLAHWAWESHDWVKPK